MKTVFVPFDILDNNKEGLLVSSHWTGQYGAGKCRSMCTVAPDDGRKLNSQGILKQTAYKNYTGARQNESSLYILIYMFYYIFVQLTNEIYTYLMTLWTHIYISGPQSGQSRACNAVACAP